MTLHSILDLMCQTKFSRISGTQEDWYQRNMIKLAIIPLFCPQPLVLASFSSVLMAVLQRSTGLSLSSELGTKLPLSKL